MPDYETMSNLVQCNICQKWYSNQHGLLIHLRFCRDRHACEQNTGNHHIHGHNPLKSCYDQDEHHNPFAVYDDEFDNSSILDQNSTSSEQEDLEGGGNLTEDDLGDINDEVDELANYGYEDTNRQCTTAVSKLQIRLNDLINQHKAPLQLHDDIVHLFNDYISSENFSKYGKLKTRQSFIKQIEVSHPGVKALRPVNKQVTIHNGTQVTVPVFDARAMIMDILTNPDQMRKENIAEGYDIFTGDIDENHPSNQIWRNTYW